VLAVLARFERTGMYLFAIQNGMAWFITPNQSSALRDNLLEVADAVRRRRAF